MKCEDGFSYSRGTNTTAAKPFSISSIQLSVKAPLIDTTSHDRTVVLCLIYRFHVLVDINCLCGSAI